ncbi:MAG: ATP-binding protein, partial [Gammaproteobacteria bacterium]
MRSIEARLNGGLALSLILVFVLLGILMSVAFRMLAEGYILARLEHDAESLLTALIVRTGAESSGLRADRLDPVYQRAFSGHYYRIEVAGQVLRSRSLWDQDLDVPTVGVGEARALRLDGPEDQLLLVRVAAYRKAGEAVTITVAEDLSPIRAEVRQAQLRYVLFGVIALALLLLLQRAILRSGLRPLAHTGDELDALEQGERRALSEAVPREVLPLVRKINRLLATLQQRLQRSRNALGNLAHALKTPLTLLGQIADRDDSFRDAETAERTRALIEKIRTLTERELRRARLAGTAEHGGQLRLRGELEALAEVLRQLYRERDVRIEVDVPAGLSLAADREDMHELFGNLFDNACKWARARVRVRAARDRDGVTIAFEDDGPGRDDAELERLNRRGVRIDEGAVPGHGLGLAI